MEGQFNRKTKTEFHPHTNMAKASLNMMTRTAGISYKKNGIYMTCVDTGWITDERPVNLRPPGFVPPLDCVDGAARIYDPIIMGITGKRLYNSVFLKDYVVSEW